MRAERFGTAPDGSAVHRVVIENGGTRASLMTWGASLQDFRRAGTDHALVLGSSDFAAYLGPMRHFGAIAGPLANRIAGGRAPLEGRILELERNEKGRTTLHNGASGTSVNNWDLEGADATSCRLRFVKPDGQGGLPGRLTLVACYRLEEDGALSLEITADTDAPTLCNPAHHSYWALTPEGGAAAHRMRIAAQHYLPTDADQIPLDVASVAGTRFDFRDWRAAYAPGDAALDHNFCLDAGNGQACLLEAGGLRLGIETTEPGMQVYDGGGIATGTFVGHQGEAYGAHAGIALEPQRWPDAPNRPEFPSVQLMPGEVRVQKSRFRVSPCPD